MSKRSLVVLLIVSLVFNLAVFFSLIWQKTQHPKRRIDFERTQSRPRMPERIERAEFSPELIQYRKDFDDAKLQLMQELSKAEPDEAKIQSIIEASLNAQSNLERELGLRLLHYRRQLTAQEADEYFGGRAEQIIQRRNYRQNPRRNPHEKNTDNNTNPRSRPRRPYSPDSPR